jgi:hypothetical protein
MHQESRLGWVSRSLNLALFLLGLVVAVGALAVSVSKGGGWWVVALSAFSVALVAAVLYFRQPVIRTMRRLLGSTSVRFGGRASPCNDAPEDLRRSDGFPGI